MIGSNPRAATVQITARADRPRNQARRMHDFHPR